MIRIGISKTSGKKEVRYTGSGIGTAMTERFLELLATGRPIVFDGGTGTTLFDRGVFINRCYDQVNLTDPELVRRVHREFVAAGAMVIETNTFGANRYKLASFDLASKVREINLAGASLAKEAAGPDVLVAGSVGPLGIHLEPLFRSTDESTAKDAFIEQITALVDGGVDLILFETFADMEEARIALAAGMAVRQATGRDIPLACSFTVNQEGNTIYGARAEEFAAMLEKAGADVMGINCSVGPKSMLDTLERVRKVSRLPVIVMPNAGLPTEIEGRTFYMCSPDYMANYARRFVQVGAAAVGGCCGTTPDHIRAIAASIRQMTGEQRSLQEVSSLQEETVAPMPEIPFAQRSQFAKKLAAGDFVATVELAPPQGWDQIGRAHV